MSLILMMAESNQALTKPDLFGVLLADIKRVQHLLVALYSTKKKAVSPIKKPRLLLTFKWYVD